MTIDTTKLPLVLPATVARVTADGLPTKHLIDWEQYTRDWYEKSAIDTETRLTEVKSETDGNTAAITEETNARTSADSALAEQITTVDAKVGTVSANGQIYFGAAATPAGAVAAYGLYLTAGGAFTGFEAIARSDGTSAIGFKASQFYFTDSGAGQQVLSYTAGKFTFTADVQVDGDLLVNGSVDTVKVGTNAITTQASGQATVAATTVNVPFSTTGANAQAVILVSFSPVIGGGTASTSSTVSIDGATKWTLEPPYDADGVVVPITFHRITTISAKGSHTLTVTGVANGAATATIMTFNK